ncbi:MAG: hypothetical protein J7K83_04025 [Candidatus Aenigmarchaeota archaeon]|nr:hypothetical protein [Candidatus Aenigmarchaeota archaeon]
MTEKPSEIIKKANTTVSKMKYGVEKTVYSKQGLVTIKVKTTDDPKKAVIYLVFPKSAEWSTTGEKHNEELEDRLLDYFYDNKIKYSGINNVDWAEVPIDQLDKVISDIKNIVEKYLSELKQTAEKIESLA